MILGIKSDSADAELTLYIDENTQQSRTWHADRTLARDLLATIDTFLSELNKSWSDIKGIVVFRGPGSFTGLRIGITTANSAAYSLNIPIVGAAGDDWMRVGVARLHNGENDVSVLPEYGADPRITKPKK